MHCCASCDTDRMALDNKVDPINGRSVFPFEWHSLGATLRDKDDDKQALAARCNFTVRRGYDPVQFIDYGRVVEGLGDLGFSLRSKGITLNVSATNLVYKTGQDEPVRAQSVLGQALSGLKVMLVREYVKDSYVAIAYDIKQQKPELSFCWTGETFQEKASLLASVDPVDRSMKLNAALVFPGPEWRVDVYDEDNDVVEEPKDYGARHKVYLEQVLKPRDMMHRTRVGIKLDVGRVLNCLGDYIQYNVEQRIPQVLWKIPFSKRVFDFLVPGEDEEQMRYHLKGWDVDVSHDFSLARPKVGLFKNFRHATVGLSYDLDKTSVGLEYSRSGFQVVASLGKREDGWKNPSIELMVEPLAFL